MNNKFVGVIGLGHLGLAVSVGLSKSGYTVLANNKTLHQTNKKLSQISHYQIKASSLKKITQNCSIIILCVTHDQLIQVSNRLKPILSNKHLVITCLAQASLGEVSSRLNVKGLRIVKLMTTLGVVNQTGVSGYHTTDLKIDPNITQLITDISAKNCVLKLDSENDMHVFTALVGCFPGIQAYLLRHLELCALRHGGKSFESYKSTLSSLLHSTADLLDTTLSAKELESKVKTSGGVTEAILDTLELHSEIFEQAIVAGLQKMKGKG